MYVTVLCTDYRLLHSILRTARCRMYIYIYYVASQAQSNDRSSTTVIAVQRLTVRSSWQPFGARMFDNVALKLKLPVSIRISMYSRLYYRCIYSSHALRSTIKLMAAMLVTVRSVISSNDDVVRYHDGKRRDLICLIWDFTCSCTW